ncbi:hypothetical protein GCM10025868_39070 [Angustibacter aerolatus]|uniref:ABC transporter domain-containing protein n=1 Tax=Angustibacter aerolatus TaxID=1162965 RepID=A0ABQ6JLK0_9ACTN|nr:ATP-binding cassette domain-containing protein [Angustibacter aerolatus]GMA88657.1 hypothetical protein GCM10025868_39070 [Angustibacter aerolatus]
MSGPAIEVDDLHKRYGDLQAVAGVSFTVERGEFFGILGPNGAGKTTTLEMVEGLREPDSGSVRLLGESPWPRNPRLLPRMGVQAQASAFFEKAQRPRAGADVRCAVRRAGPPRRRDARAWSA